MDTALDAFVRTGEAVGLAIEGFGVLVITVSVVLAAVLFARRTLSAARRQDAYADTRRFLGRGVLLGLELLVAGDIVRTVVVGPSLSSVGLLGLIVVIRTFLSFTLELEIDGRWPWARRDDVPVRPGGAAG